jgi:aminoglycoside phosphotransferase (APT) family kinase protein
MSSDTTAVRQEEQLDLAALSAHLGGPVEVEQFPGGHSNLTYLVRLDGAEYVLRRPPLGPVAPKAHDMAREFRFLEAVHPVFPLAPRPHRLCEDPSVIGAPFYLMERRRGRIIRREIPGWLSLELRRPIAAALVDTLVALHAVDASKPPVSGLGRPAGFLERQLSGWSSRWERARTGEAPEMERIIGWLGARIPEPQGAALLHNDYKLDNIMLDEADPARVIAVLDWELAALGDPLIDLGLALCYWPEPGDPPERRDSITPVTAAPGWPSRAEVIERYAAASGRDVSRIAYYEIFAFFKLAVVLQQIYHRYHLGQTTDARFAELDRRVRSLIHTASDLISRADS